MFLGIDDAVEEIMETVEGALGPVSQNFQFTLADAVDFGIQLAATIILFLVVRIFLWKPITNILEARRQAIDKSLSDAQAAKENASLVEAKLKSELAEAKAKVKEMIDKAEKDANIKRETIINDAKEEARKRLDNLKLELEQEKKSMEKQIREEIVDVAFLAAEKIVAKEINRDKYLDVVDDILKGANE